ncbi:MAG: hypothetical protein J1F03_07585 [Oscillospiraceae bacterium]|nr:hypothetical protein [Oscillospiraceae bacterium]
MAQIPQINNPITAKNYNYSPRQQDESTEPFDIVKLTGVGSAGVNSDSASKSRLEMGNRELIPLQVQVAKDPTLAVEVLKDLLNVEVLNQALITGHTELYGSLENLAKELYVTPDDLVEEIQNQEQQNTMFSGHEFYDVLREVAQTTKDPNTKELIGNLLKSINFVQNKNEILGALRANLKFLSEYYSPNEKLSERLYNLSQEWGAEDAEKYFDYLKTETLAILKDVSGSLLNDDKTQMLIPLITHNLSRYNNSPYLCKEYFNLLLTQITSGTLRESLKNSFNRLFAALFDKKPMQDPQTMEGVANMPGGEELVEELGQELSAVDKDPAQDPQISENLMDMSEEIIPDGESDTESAKSADGQLPTNNYTTNEQQNQALSTISDDKNLNNIEQNSQIQQNDKISEENSVEFDDIVFDEKTGVLYDRSTGDVYEKSTEKVYDEKTGKIYHRTTGAVLGQAEGEIYDENTGDVYEKSVNLAYDPQRNEFYVKDDESGGGAAAAVYEFEGWRKYLNELMSDKSYTQQLKASGFNIEHILANYNRGKLSGMDSLRMLTEGLFLKSQGDPEAIRQCDVMLSGFDKVNTMQELIDNLNSMLQAMPDIPLRERLYGVFVGIIEKMSIKNELPQHGIRPPVSSTLDNLTDFIQRNINNPALKSLDSFNAANLLQSLLNAPGVFTPLAHYILPLQAGGTKAFGELWVDNDENNPNNTPGTQRNYHLFLTFDIDSIGRFEVDMYALGNEVNLSLLYPPKFEREIEPLKERVNKIIKNTGYSARAFETAPLKKPHNLLEVFPKINDKRTTLNKRV